LRSEFSESIRLATTVNQYLDQTSPWSEDKKDKDEAAKTIYTALRAIDSLKVIFDQFLPFTSEKLHQYLGYDTPLFGEQYIEEVEDSLGTHTVLRYRPADDAEPKWKCSKLEPNQQLRQPGPLFKKLEESIIEEERARLGK